MIFLEKFEASIFCRSNDAFQKAIKRWYSSGLLFPRFCYPPLLTKRIWPWSAMQRSTYVVRTTGITDTRDDARSLHGAGDHSHCSAEQGCNSMTTIYDSSLISWLEECHTVSMDCGTANRRITVALGCKIYNAVICMMLTHRFWWSGYIYI